MMTGGSGGAYWIILRNSQGDVKMTVASLNFLACKFRARFAVLENAKYHASRPFAR